jgi:1-phosphofructokinase
MAIGKKLGIGEMLRYGIAAANASLIREGTLLCTREDFERMFTGVKIEMIG